MSTDILTPEQITEDIWNTKYKAEGEEKWEDTAARISKFCASIEEDEDTQKILQDNYYRLINNKKFLPGGRITANAGTDRKETTLLNCFVMGTIQDSMDGIFQSIKESAITQKMGGGVGFDFSTIRPRGGGVKGIGATASGPVSFMSVYDSSCSTIMSAGQRRGAMLACLRCDHPDIEEFIEAKRGDENNKLTQFNLSVGITDDFMEAVEKNKNWKLTFEGKTYKTLKARELWDKITKSAYDYAEPGVLFLDRIKEANPLNFKEVITSSNPCGEVPLPPYGACLLGSFNLTQYVEGELFSKDQAIFDFDSLKEDCYYAVSLLDCCLDLSNFPLEAQREEAHNKRRMGIGITGLADALLLLGVKYDSEEGVQIAETIMREINYNCYEASISLAETKGCCPIMMDTETRDKYVSSDYFSSIDHDGSLRERLLNSGIRNTHLTSIAPTGTMSLVCGNVSNGIEPVFSWEYNRRIKQDGGSEKMVRIQDYAYFQYRQAHPENGVPDFFTTTDTIAVDWHIKMQGALQKHVCNAISKTINIPTHTSFDDFKEVYTKAYEAGVKGCTTFRPSDKFMGVLIKDGDAKKEAKEKTSFVATRPDTLSGQTYKIKSPHMRDAVYVTINDMDEDGVKRPYELFVSTKASSHLPWITALSRTISAVFRHDPKPLFLLEELKSVYDPAGGYYSKGKYVPSLVADIGGVLEKHMESLGITTEDSKKESFIEACPSCGENSLARVEGCLTCKSCGYSKCG